MNPTKLIGIILIAAGCLGLIYGGFTYTKQTSAVKLGPLELKVQEKETVSVPLIVSAGAIAVGVFLLVAVGRKCGTKIRDANSGAQPSPLSRAERGGSSFPSPWGEGEGMRDGRLSRSNVRFPDMSWPSTIRGWQKSLERDLSAANSGF